MKNRTANIILSLGFTLVFISSCVAQNCDSMEAKRIFEKELQLIESYLDKKNIELEKLPLSIKLIERITSIESESDGNYLGKFNPTTNDLKRWKTWYSENKSHICWDKDKQELYINNKATN